MTRTARALALLASAALVVAVPTAAQAGKPVFRSEPYEFAVSFNEPDFCGIAVHFEVEGSGVSHVLPVKGSDQAFLAHDNFSVREVISTASGSISTYRRGTFLEQKATHVTGDIWEFVSLDIGPFWVYDSDGNLLLRATGVFKASEQFDTLGDSQPGAVPVEGTFEPLAGHGLSFTDDEFCDAVLPELT